MMNFLSVLMVIREREGGWEHNCGLFCLAVL